MVEGKRVNAAVSEGCSETEEVKEGLIPGGHQYLRGKQKHEQQRRMGFLP